MEPVEDYVKDLIKELAGVKASIDSMGKMFVEQLKSLEDRVDSNIHMTELQVKGQHELLEKEVSGLAARVDSKLAEHEEQLQGFKSCEASCTEKRHGIHERMDKLRDEKVLPNEKRVDALELKFGWIMGVLGVVGVATVWTLIDMIRQWLGG